MTMRVCFVYADVGGVEQYGARKFYHGVAFLSSILKAAGHETSLLYLDQEPERASFMEQLDALNPQVVAFSSTTHQHRFVSQCAAWLRQDRPHLFCLSGGIHPTLVPEEVVADTNLDAVCVGEGEHALLELVTALEAGEDWHGIANIWWRDEAGNVTRNALRPLVTELDTLPHPDRELFDYANILGKNGHVADMMAGRGCPYNCSYCCNHALKRRYSGLGAYVRFRSPDDLLGELAEMAARYDIRVVNLQDDTFTLHKSWTIAFCQAYAARFDYPFWINTRVEHLDAEMIQMLAEAGCQRVRIGIESGNEALRRTILKRKMSNDDFRRAFSLLHRYGIETYTCNMIGIPGETPEMIQETIDLNRELSPTKFQFSVFYPYPMTELGDTCLEQGMIEPKTLESTTYYDRASVLSQPTLSQEALAEGYDRFVELRAELSLKRRGGWRYWIYRLIYKLYGGDMARFRRHLARIKGSI